MKPYTPIDCNFYDELVLLSMRKTPITFIPNKYNIPLGDYIKDLITLPSKEEFLVMSSGTRIRLDEISTSAEHMLFLQIDESYFEEEEEEEE